MSRHLVMTMAALALVLTAVARAEDGVASPSPAAPAEVEQKNVETAEAKPAEAATAEAAKPAEAAEKPAAKTPEQEADEALDAVLQKLDREHTAEAIESVRKLIAAHPKHFRSRVVLATLLLMTDKKAEAVASVEECYASDPETYESVLAEILTKALSVQEALDHVGKKIAAEPKNPRLHLLNAAVRIRLRQPDEALAAADEAIKLAPEMASAHMQRGRVLMSMDKMAEARKSLLRGAELEPLSVTCWKGAAICAQQLKDYAEAEKYATKAHELEPADSSNLSRLLEILYAQNKLEQAAPYRKKILELYEKDPEMQERSHFSFDRFALGEMEVVAMEAFKKEGHLYYAYTFRAYDKAGEFVESVNFEWSLAFVATDVKYILGGTLPDGTHLNCGVQFEEELPYAKMKEIAIKYLSKRHAPQLMSKPDGGIIIPAE